MKKIAKKLVRAAGYEVTRTRVSSFAIGEKIHFLHIGKNAGTQISHIASQVNEKSSAKKIVHHKHDFRLKDLPRQEQYFFSIRNPSTRFVSGFYSRKRKGMPRIHNEWSEHDRVAFSVFEHANELAESLFLPGADGDAAWAAMKSIKHTSQNQSDWFDCCGNFLKVHPPIWIIRQEHFADDLGVLLSKADFGIEMQDIQITTNKKTAHANDYSDIPALSENARSNLERWYAQDYMLYEICVNWLESSRKDLCFS